jgi:hypothetical protein
MVGWLCAAAVVALTPAARAGDRNTSAKDVKTTSSSNGDYGYIFDVDPMQAGAMTPDDPILRVVTHGVRQTLIRPRTQFVPELLKTVENM